MSAIIPNIEQCEKTKDPIVSYRKRSD